MTIHLIRIAVITILLTLCIFLPYLPGEYDILAPTLSFLAQLLCFAGLLLVPIGIAWLIYELLKRNKKEKTSTKTTYYFGITALIVMSIIALAVSMTAFVSNNLSLGIMALTLYGLVSVKMISNLNQLKSAENFTPTPLYLICIPLLVLLIRFTFINKAVDYSRNIAIQHSEQLISDIETYYKNNGHYPFSILSVNLDYKTSVKGIKQYHYEPNGNAYNLYFEHVSGDLAAKEIVMYNKLDEHVMTSHDQDILLLSALELNQQRGYFAAHELPNLHWKYFLFD